MIEYVKWEKDMDYLKVLFVFTEEKTTENVSRHGFLTVVVVYLTTLFQQLRLYSVDF
jgi:hypothetical protein